MSSFELPQTANFDCKILDGGHPLNFNQSFKPKGNFTFSWATAVSFN